MDQEVMFDKFGAAHYQKGLTREYVNQAVYVENYDCYNRIVKVKRCICLVEPTACPCHPQKDEINDQNYSASISRVSSNESTATTVLIPSSKPSMISLTANDEERAEVFRRWLKKKNSEKKLFIEHQIEMQGAKETERQTRLELERENFVRWITLKKKEEGQRKKETNKKSEEQKAKKEVKNQRNLESELNYQLWTKRKEQKCLENQIKDQMKLLKTTEEKQRRSSDSRVAYSSWLKSSKDKPLPLPLNQGLQSLQSSLSVTYINPTPWVPNIDCKPVSQ